MPIAPRVADSECEVVVRVSVIVPLLNEENGIPLLAKTLAALKDKLHPQHELECVLVDDGSTDATLPILRTQFGSDPSFVITSHGRNRGPGAAFRTGFQNSTGDVICTIDADCTFDPLQIPEILDAMQRTGADIGIGSPYHPKGAVENVKPWRLMLSKGCSVMYRLITPIKLYSYTSFMRAYRRSVIDTVAFESDGFSAVTEILLRAMMQGYTAVEVPSVLKRRVLGVSKMNVFRNIRSQLFMAARFVGWRFLGWYSPLPSGPSAITRAQTATATRKAN
jgi:dolichol-phosphate mannosyltransferase